MPVLPLFLSARLRLLGAALVLCVLVAPGLSPAATEAPPVRIVGETALALTEDSSTNLPSWRLEKESDRRLTLNLGIPGVTLQAVEADGRTWQRLALPGAFATGEAGSPELPVLGRLVRVPAGMTLEATVTAADPVTLPGLQIFPVQEDQAEAFSLDDGAYSRARNLADAQPKVRVGQPAIMAGSTVVPLNIEAVAYDPASGELVIWHEVELELRLVPTAGMSTARPNAPLPASFATSVLDGTDDATGLSGFGTYVAIHAGQGGVVEGIAPLLDWRRRQGYHVIVLNTLLIGNNTGSIKDALQEIYDNPDLPPLEFVTIFGDASGTYAVPAWNESLSGYGGDGDHYYVQLEGDDILADAHIGRVSFSNPTEMNNVVGKILDYETAPPMDDTAWFGRACLQGDPSSSGITTIYVNQWLKGQLQDLGWTHVDTTWSGNFPLEMVNSVNQGVSAYGYRGYLGTSGISNGTVGSLTNGGRLALAILPTCGSGSFADQTARSEAWLRAPNGGAVAAIGTATTGTHTRYNNCYYLGTWDGVLNRGDARIGVAHTLGKVAVYNGYYLAEPHEAEIWAVWNNVMGDGATRIWVGVPTGLDVAHAATLATAGQAFPVSVTSDGQPVAGAVVTLFHEDVLMGDHMQVSGVTGPDGTVVLDVPAANAGPVDLTVTAPGHLPFQGSVNAGQPGVFCGVSAMDTGGTPTPGARLPLTTTLVNQGTEEALDVIAQVSVLEGPGTLSGPTLEFGIIPAGGQAVAPQELTLDIDPDARDGAVLRLLVTATDGLETWQSLHDLPVSAADLTVDSLDLGAFGGHVDPGETGDLALTLRNLGSLDAPAVSATLRTDSPWIILVNEAADFGDIPINQTGLPAGAPLRIAASTDTFGGHLAILHLDLVYGDGAQATTSFALTVGSEDTDQPTGPDAYGYYAFDNTDIGSQQAPEFAWVGIDPDHGGQGSDLGLQDFGWEQDETKTMDLPFSFRFYGEDYDQVSICSNGWVAMGETPVAFYRNFPLPAPHSAGALVAPFWDNLYQSGANKVYTWHDTENHRFIVQWYNMRNTYTNAPQNFELILLDPTHHPTATGDGMIVFQYETVSDTDTRDGHATIGIQNMDRDVGLNYAYWNQYAAGAAQAVSGRAILLAPYGPPPSPQALVTPPSFAATVLPDGQESLYLHISNPGEEGSLLAYEIDVRDPLLTAGRPENSDGDAGSRNLTGSSVTTTLTGYNAGETVSLPLTVTCVSDDIEWLMRVELDLPADVTVESATDIDVPNGAMEWNEESGEGVTTTWGTGGLGSGGFLQPGQTGTGSVQITFAADLTGDVVIPWSVIGDQFGQPPHDVGGELVLSPLSPSIVVTAPVAGQVATLGDPLDVEYTAANGPTLVNIDVQRSLDDPWQNLAFALPADQGTWTWNVSGNPTAEARIRVRDTSNPEVAGYSGVFGIGRNLDWVQPSALSGAVPQGQVAEVEILLDAADLALGLHQAVLIIQHNAGPAVSVPVDLTVTDASNAGETPLQTRLLGNFPDPFNPSTTIAFSLARSGRISLDVYDLRGSRVVSLLQGVQPAGRHHVVWNGQDQGGRTLASGVYFYRLETDAGPFTGKMILAK